jgi:hypothetical protein
MARQINNVRSASAAAPPMRDARIRRFMCCAGANRYDERILGRRTKLELQRS